MKENLIEYHFDENISYRSCVICFLDVNDENIA